MEPWILQKIQVAHENTAAVFSDCLHQLPSRSTDRLMVQCAIHDATAIQRALVTALTPETLHNTKTLPEDNYENIAKIASKLRARLRMQNEVAHRIHIHLAGLSHTPPFNAAALDTIHESLLLYLQKLETETFELLQTHASTLKKEDYCVLDCVRVCRARFEEAAARLHEAASNNNVNDTSQKFELDIAKHEMEILFDGMKREYERAHAIKVVGLEEEVSKLKVENETLEQKIKLSGSHEMRAHAAEIFKLKETFSEDMNAMRQGFEVKTADLTALLERQKEKLTEENKKNEKNRKEQQHDFERRMAMVVVQETIEPWSGEEEKKTVYDALEGKKRKIEFLHSVYQTQMKNMTMEWDTTLEESIAKYESERAVAKRLADADKERLVLMTEQCCELERDARNIRITVKDLERHIAQDRVDYENLQKMKNITDDKLVQSVLDVTNMEKKLRDMETMMGGGENTITTLQMIIKERDEQIGYRDSELKSSQFQMSRLQEQLNALRAEILVYQERARLGRVKSARKETEGERRRKGRAPSRTPSCQDLDPDDRSDNASNATPLILDRSQGGFDAYNSPAKESRVTPSSRALETHNSFALLTMQNKNVKRESFSSVLPSPNQQKPRQLSTSAIRNEVPPVTKNNTETVAPDSTGSSKKTPAAAAKPSSAPKTAKAPQPPPSTRTPVSSVPRERHKKHPPPLEGRPLEAPPLEPPPPPPPPPVVPVAAAPAVSEEAYVFPPTQVPVATPAPPPAPKPVPVVAATPAVPPRAPDPPPAPVVPTTAVVPVAIAALTVRAQDNDAQFLELLTSLRNETTPLPRRSSSIVHEDLMARVTSWEEALGAPIPIPPAYDAPLQINGTIINTARHMRNVQHPKAVTETNRLHAREFFHYLGAMAGISQRVCGNITQAPMFTEWALEVTPESIHDAVLNAAQDPPQALSNGEVLRVVDFLVKDIVGRGMARGQYDVASTKRLFEHLQAMHSVVRSGVGEIPSSVITPVSVSDIFKRVIAVMRVFRSMGGGGGGMVNAEKAFKIVYPNLHTWTCDMEIEKEKRVKTANPIQHLITALQTPKYVSQLKMYGKAGQQPLARLLSSHCTPSDNNGTTNTGLHKLLGRSPM